MMARLLVVDDEQDILDLVVKRLMREGYEILAADCAATALALVQQHGPPDGAVLDVDLPDVDGFELQQRLLETDPQLVTLFLTVLWSAEVRARIDQASALYLAKPFTAAGLAGAVRELLAVGGRRAQRHGSGS